MLLGVNQKKENLLQQIERYIFNGNTREVDRYKRGTSHYIELYDNAKEKSISIEIESQFFNHINFNLVKINGEPLDIYCEWNDMQVEMYDVMINYISFLRVHESANSTLNNL